MIPHQRRIRELQAMRRLIDDLEALAATSIVGTVEATDVAAIFENHTSALPEQSELLRQFESLAAALRRGPARTRVEGIRQIVRKIREKADDFGRQLEERDARLRAKGG